VNGLLRDAIKDACLKLSNDALVIFDAMEGTITIDTARAVVDMGNQANDIAHGVQALVVTGG
jgi:hypothetical protein